MDTAELEQKTHAWLMARVGHATGSRFRDVLSRLKTGAPAQARKDYAMQLVVERMTGQPTSQYVNQFMQWGTEQEPAARELFVQRSGMQVDEVGFIKHKTLMAGVSPDGILELGDGILEIKAPTSVTHANTWLHGMDESHLPQVQGAMWVTGAKYAMFVSYDPRFPVGGDLYMQRVERDDAYISRLESEVSQFLYEVDEQVKMFEARFLVEFTKGW